MFDVMLIVFAVMSFSVLLGGIYMRYYSPKDEGMNVGFRTKTATSSAEAWEYANKACGKGWIIIGATGVSAGVLLQLLVFFLFSVKIAEILAVVCMFVFTVIGSSGIVSVMRKTDIMFDKTENPTEKGADDDKN